MKFKKLTKLAALGLAGVMAMGTLSGCGKKEEPAPAPAAEGGEAAAQTEAPREIVELVWYQIGDAQKDQEVVLEKVNEYLAEKIGVKLKILTSGWGDYGQKMQVVINTGDTWDLCFTCSWANDYRQNVQKGAFLALDDLLQKEGAGVYEAIDERFWEAAKIGGSIYGVPSEKEIGSVPMWVFNKELVDKYEVPYEEIHSLEDLEPWLQLIKENEPDVVPMYLTKDYSAPIYMDLIQNPLGIEYDDPTLTVQNVFETDKMKETLNTMRKYFEAGYINKDAATASDDKSIKRFVTKGDGQPYAELVWGKDLGYEVVATQIMDTRVTNTSARGALTAINKNTKYPERCMELLNLINTDEYLRNLLNYGIEGTHWEKVELTEEDKALTERPYTFDHKIKLTDAHKDYAVSYWVQGGLFNTYVLENEPLDKWAVFKEFNDASVDAPSFGFDFNLEPVATQVAGFQNVLDEFGKALYTGSVEPDEYLPQLQKKLEATGINEVKEEMQRQIDEWKATMGGTEEGTTEAAEDTAAEAAETEAAETEAAETEAAETETEAAA